MSVPTRADHTVRLHRLTMVAEPDGVVVGRPAIGSYALFPDDGAELLRMLGDGVPVPEAAAFYERAAGAPLDLDDFFEMLAELGFLLGDGEEEPAAVPLRWRRLGRLVFSRTAFVCYVLLVVAAAVDMARDPALRPSYRDVFFIDHISLIPIVLAALQVPCLILHECFHMLAGRRLGLPSKMSVGRRLYYLVAETRMDALLSVPRNKRYLPFLAGMLLDTLLVAALTLAASALTGHVPGWIPALCLAVSFVTLLRLIWQFMFYLETDLYHVIATALRCVDLQNATRFCIRNRIRRMLGRGVRRPDDEWSERDRKVARWYAPVLILGYGFSLCSLGWAGIPTAIRFWRTVFERLSAPGTAVGDVVDALVFLALVATQLGLLAYVTVRDRRARRAASSRGERA